MLLALSVAALLLSGCARGGDTAGGGDDGAGGDRAEEGAGGDGAAEEPPITDLEQIVSASDKRELAGRRVEAAEADVLEVPNARSLFVGEGEAERVFVSVRRIPGGPSGNTSATEGEQERRRFAEGQTVELTGVVRPVPESADEAFRRFGLGREQFELVQDEEVFIRAASVRVADGG